MKKTDFLAILLGLLCITSCRCEQFDVIVDCLLDPFNTFDVDLQGKLIL